MEKRQKVMFAILGVLVVVFLARTFMGGGGGGGGGTGSESEGGRGRDRTEQSVGAPTGATTTDTTPADATGPSDAPPLRNPFAPSL